MERRLAVKEFNHENIQGLLNCIRDGVFITDGDGNIIPVSYTHLDVYKRQHISQRI